MSPRGEVCLQGGAEFRAGCEGMDSAMLHGPDGEPRRVVVAPFAGRPGRERATAAANATRWYRGLGARDVVVAPDEGPAFADTLAGGGLLVLPGGSPGALLQALAPHAEALRSAHEAGLAISGASAGAMVLCRWTVLPGGRPGAVPALGLVPVDLVLVHYSGGRGWLDAARPVLPENPVVLGLPERSGVVVDADGGRRPVGVERACVL